MIRSKRTTRWIFRLLLVALAMAWHVTPVFAGRNGETDSSESETKETQSQQTSTGLDELSLSDLLNVEVSSASRKLEELSKTSAATYVITQRDIHRMGATSLPEVLRMVPGLHVARIDANKWSISSRGFSTQFSNKLLVLIDGRSVYTLLYSGVYWDANDLVMEDVDRIEVIRGPGAALWGANAVGGVINVITKKAQDTRGFLVSAAGGSQEGYGAVRYGGQNGDHLAYRLYGKYSNTDNFPSPDGTPSVDAWDIASGGFRLDWTKDADRWSLLGSGYRGDLDSTVRQPLFQPPFVGTVDGPNQTTGFNVLSRWTRSFGLGNDLSVQAYFDRFERDQPALVIGNRNTFDVEVQHGLVAGANDVVWGGRFRRTSDDLPPSSYMSWNPPQQSDNLGSLFAQDRIALGTDFRICVKSKPPASADFET